MKKLIQSSLLLLASVIGGTANAQTKTSENSLLWEISGNGLSKSSYLYGTVHMMCESDFKMTDKTLKAFAKTDKLALEIDMDDPAELNLMQQSAMGKEPLSKTLNPEDYQKLDAFLKEKLGKDAKTFENYTLTTIMSVVMFKSLNCPPKMYEMEFMKMATDRKMETIGLEKLSEQLDFLGKAYSDHEMIDQIKLYGSEYFKALIPVYTSEQIYKLYQLTISPKYMDAEDKKYMLDIRNNNWAKKMPDLMKKESVFFAVGAAHLPGEQGVLQLLKNAGYTVKPVMN
ncbi:TraB/GumN family protein [Flavobacterium sp. SM15]|uniref:TraB/GumN family protein n=1 Tax=Flavobacterium sp. SM15 TaxID=2908005 RepID=UPI001EDB7C1A|nr:TraB/GumN family protein [Flavobacterium sp. SM15]MCG2612186.1 TraB/GumN family protein [Flavobacterium sp. SM15]